MFLPVENHLLKGRLYEAQDLHGGGGLQRSGQNQEIFITRSDKTNHVFRKEYGKIWNICFFNCFYRSIIWAWKNHLFVNSLGPKAITETKAEEATSKPRRTKDQKRL